MRQTAAVRPLWRRRSVSLPLATRRTRCRSCATSRWRTCSASSPVRWGTTQMWRARSGAVAVLAAEAPMEPVAVHTVSHRVRAAAAVFCLSSAAGARRELVRMTMETTHSSSPAMTLFLPPRRRKQLRGAHWLSSVAAAATVGRVAFLRLRVVCLPFHQRRAPFLLFPLSPMPPQASMVPHPPASASTPPERSRLQLSELSHSAPPAIVTHTPRTAPLSSPPRRPQRCES